jgi:hypothetical protein
MTISDVFDKALLSLTRRVADFRPRKRSFTLSERIRVANAYLIPLLQYPMRFYVAPPQVLRKALDLIERWVLPIWRAMPPVHPDAPPQNGGASISADGPGSMQLGTMLQESGQGHRGGPI